MPSCMRLALARERHSSPFLTLFAMQDNLQSCLVSWTISAGCCPCSACHYADKILLIPPSYCLKKLTALPHTCIRSEIRRMLIGRELFKESTPA